VETRYWERAPGKGGRAKEPATRELRGAKLVTSFLVLEEKMNKRTREERTVTIDPSSICLDGTDKGPQVVKGRRPLLLN